MLELGAGRIPAEICSRGGACKLTTLRYRAMMSEVGGRTEMNILLRRACHTAIAVWQSLRASIPHHHHHST